MRVLAVGNMYPPHHLGGYELMWRGAMSELRARGHEVRILATDYQALVTDPGLAEEHDVHRELRWYWHAHEFPKMSLRERFRLERENLKTLRRHLREFSPAVVNWWAMGGMSMSMLDVPAAVGLPAVGVVVDDWLLYGPRVDGWQRAWRRAGPLRPVIGRLAGVPTGVELGEAAQWLVVSETVRRHAAEGRVPLVGSEIVHGGVDPALFPQATPREWAGRLVYVGRIDPRKGIATAVRALADLSEATLTIVGGGDDAHLSELRALAIDIGVAGRVGFEQRRRDELAAVYADADAVVFPVLWEEPWGLVPLEAMSVGRPVIATGTGGSGEYLEHERNCLIFEPKEDPRALAVAVARLASDPGLRERLVSAGRETAHELTEAAFNVRVADVLEAAA